MTRTAFPRAAVICSTALVSSLLLSPAALAAGEPARGAPTQDLIRATVVGVLLGLGLVAFGERHRRGHTQVLTRLAANAGRLSGMPGWVALPSLLAAVSLIGACFGFYWDVATHIDNGRDPGPFANTAHFFILGGLAGILLAGYLAVLLGTGERTRTSISLRPGWHVPLGGLLILLCGGFAISGFPLDDVWHRLFGQDVTLWGPTHILMIGGASLSTLGIWVLLAEGRRAEGAARRRAGTDRAGSAGSVAPASGRAARAIRRLRGPGVAGGFLIGLSTLQLEFDFGVPQFRLLFAPVMIALAGGIGLVAARAWLGRFGALAAAAFYIVVNLAITLIVGPVLGHTTMSFPLYLAEAALVELVALRVPRDRPLTLAAVSGLLIGTVGLAAEWGWSHLAMPIPWTTALLPDAAIATPIAGVAGGVLGGAIARALDADLGLVERLPRWVVPAAAAAAVAVLAFPLWTNPGPPLRADVTLSEARPAPDREVQATVRLTPASAADQADWMSVLSWQGDGSRLEHLRETAPGVWRATAPVPVHGDWKTMVRLHTGRTIRAMPIYMPEDKAIPAAGVPASAHFSRPFIPDKRVLQREAIGSSALQLPAYLALLAIAATWLGAMAWGLARLGGDSGAPPTGSPRSSSPAAGRRAQPRRRPTRTGAVT